MVFSEEKEELDLPSLSSEQIASYLLDENYLIGGMISPISGHLVLRCTDLIAKGALNIDLTRQYLSPLMFDRFDYDDLKNIIAKKDYIKKNYNGWNFLPYQFIKVSKKGNSFFVTIVDDHGATFVFELLNGKTQLYSKPYGISNISSDIPSGQNDIRNLRIEMKDKNCCVVLFFPNGVERYYRYLSYNSYNVFYSLEKEIFNGKQLNYQYNNKKDISLIEATDLSRSHLYSNIKIEYSPTQITFITNSNQRSICDYEIRHYDFMIEDKKYSEHRQGKYPPILTKVCSPFYQNEIGHHNENFLLTDMDSKDYLFRCTYGLFGTTPSQYRVNQLLLPVNKDNSYLPVYTIKYDLPIVGTKEGSCSITKADGTLTIYNFSKNLQIDSIKYFDENKQLKKQKIYSWLDNGWLKSLELKDAQEHLFYKRTYEYDPFGNPIIERFVGNLSGKGTDDYWIKREYSQNGQNLLLKETQENGPTIVYTYLSNTHLLKSKLTKDYNKILMREFYEYDTSCNLISKIIDDGSSEAQNNLDNVKERRITNYILRQEYPYIHMVEWEEKKYLQDGKEILLSRKHFIYDAHGNPSKEEIYDSNGNYVYTIYREYNDKNELISETNPLGQKNTYSYDQKGRVSQLTSSSMNNRTNYDARGRLTMLSEKGNDGISHTTSWEYDLSDNIVKKRDYLGRDIFYEYDYITNKPIKTEFPPLTLDNQKVKVITKSTYDPLGYEKASFDANGNKTLYEYNAYGSLSKTTYVDGSFETFSYLKDGKLASHVDTEGLRTEYSYDLLGRVILKLFIFKGKEIAKESFKYDTFHLIEEVNKEGFVTKYTYDGYGRLKTKDFEGHTEEYFYDTLGRLFEIVKHNGANTLIIQYERDLLDRIIKERRSDLSKDILFEEAYTYDENGNRSSIIKNINEKTAIEKFSYDSFNREICHTDALNNLFETFYEEKGCLKKISIDPKKISTIELFDSQGNLSKKQILNSHEEIISSNEFSYDPNNNLLYAYNHIYEGTNYKKTICSKYEYDARNRKISFIQAYKTPLQRVTYYDYTPSGKLKSKILPDGTSLFYGYDSLGYLQDLYSSNEKVAQHFTYDKEGHLIQADDYIQQSSIKRTLDQFANILREDFSNQMFIEKKFDQFNRLLEIKIPNNGSISYTYDPLYLRAVERVTPSGCTYKHSYDEYDTSGYLFSETMVDKKIFHERDLLGRETSLKSSFFEEYCTYDDSNITKIKMDGKELSYRYDELDQLILEEGLNENVQYGYDSNYNRLKKENDSIEVNELDEIVQSKDLFCQYDKNGNLISKESMNKKVQYIYDPLGRLLEVVDDKRVVFTYDALGRRLSKTVFDNLEQKTEYYLYDRNEEIGSFDQDYIFKQLKILGNEDAIALEFDKRLFFPIVDLHHNIRGMVDSHQTKSESYSFTLFGEEKKGLYLNPWRYQQKRIDDETGLIYFGKRYYDPELGRWLSLDPIRHVNIFNLYQYVYNNPLRYIDKDGQFVFLLPLFFFGAELMIPTFSMVVTSIFYGAVTGAIAYGGYKAMEAINHRGESAEAHRMRQSYDNYYKEAKQNELLKKKKKDEEDDKQKKEFKKPKPKISDKEGAKDVPDWAKGNRPYKDESGKDFAQRLIEEKYDKTDYNTGPGSEFSRIKKWGDRSFE